ncbi:MAG TPA: hypothetical protein VGN44_15510, partial [Candidatus Angelobacter sp.]
MNALLFRLALIATLALAAASTGFAQQRPTQQRPTQQSPAQQRPAQQPRPNKMGGPIADALRELVETPAVSGYEQAVGKKIVARLKDMPQKYDAAPFGIKTDNLGNVTVTIGSGEPKRLVVAPIDEPGFVVSGITPDGYLTLQRLPQGGNLPLFNELHAAQPMKLQTAKGEWISGAMSGVSIHLQPQRQHPPSMADLDNMFLDVGATSAAQARAGGADVLSPVAIDRT